MKDLTTSMVSRQNILNNNYAIDEIKNQLKLDGVEYINDTILRPTSLYKQIRAKYSTFFHIWNDAKPPDTD